MQQLSELDLPFLPWEEEAFAADPLPYFAEARKTHPWLARCNAGYIVTEYSAMRDLYWMDDKMRPAFDGIVEFMGAQGRPYGRFLSEQMIALPDREHKLLRDTFAKKFTPRYANSLRPIMQEQINRLLDEWVPKGRIDFEEFASYYPVSVLSRMVGAPLEAIPELRSSMETIGLGVSMMASRLPALDEAIVRMDAFAHQLMDERRANPHTGDESDLLDILIEASDEGGISDRQLADLLIFLFVAGYDTSKNVLTYMMRVMIDHPEIYERCADDLDYCRKVIEEMLRYFNPGTSSRATSDDVEYRGVLIPKGTMMFYPVNISGRDPSAFEDPDRFDPDREIVPERRHMAFGLGKHMCLGQYIARTQLQEGLHAIAKRMRHPHLAGKPGWRPFPGVWGMKGLPVEFEPA